MWEKTVTSFKLESKKGKYRRNEGLDQTTRYKEIRMSSEFQDVMESTHQQAAQQDSQRFLATATMFQAQKSSRAEEPRHWEVQTKKNTIRNGVAAYERLDVIRVSQIVFTDEMPENKIRELQVYFEPEDLPFWLTPDTQ